MKSRGFSNQIFEDLFDYVYDEKGSFNLQKEAFVEEVALENVDINALGLYTLGELRKSSNKDDISNYQKSFEKYFLKSLKI